ncbi:hypothetical protein T265_01809 [Opisthorchis viverrini]|uniref:UBA domain-containing protein n=1 Tax=Opisthorchis viverrini TaxID=6198 RepID=A0A074ZX35_OPIVI|nr:hypothetical protein T265_01809 [Opisthorchis viverrini]KER32028.1 hypothetical protein T265_01809 [Opisthorchis viverrini]
MSVNTPIDVPLKYSGLCELAVHRLPKFGSRVVYPEGFPNAKNILELLTLEKHTWTLVAALYGDRVESELKGWVDTSAADFMAVRHSEREIAKLLYERDSSLREAQMLVDWLERRVREHIAEVAERYECLFNQTATWENTAHALSFLSASELKSRNLPTVLHPDATHCTGTQWHPKDQTTNDRYLNYLFLCIRGGDLQRAQRLCMQRGEFWRAVSLEGWRLFHCSRLTPNSPPYTDFGDMEVTEGDIWQLNNKWSHTRVAKVEAPVSPEPEEIVGNVNRILYKSVAWWNAENSTLPPYERAIYAALSGNLGVLTRTLPASWVDLTWAHFRALVESRVDFKLRSLLHTGPRADTLALTGKTQPLWPVDGGLTLPDVAWAPKDWTAADAFSKVESCLGWSALSYLQASSSVELDAIRRSALGDFLWDDGAQVPSTVAPGEKGMTGEPSLSVLLYCILYATQQTVVTRDYDPYLKAVACVMPRLVQAATGYSNADESLTLRPPFALRTSSTKNPIVCQALRFLAHFILFLRSVEPDIPDEPCAQIIKAYLSILMTDHRIELIANYTATLPTSAVRLEWYSSYLSGIIDSTERERCLKLAAQAGFDVQCLTRAVVRLLREQHMLVPYDDTTPPNDQKTADDRLITIEKMGIAALLQEDQVENLSEVNRMRLSSLDWLFYDPRQRGEALILVNSFLRTFIAMNSLKAAQKVLLKLPSGTLERAKIICEDCGSPSWLVNTIREHECLLLYLESQEAFAGWFKQAHENRPPPPTGPAAPRSLTERVQAEESKRAYEDRLERWRHELQLDTEVAAEKLLALLTYPAPGWLVDLPSKSEDDVPVIREDNITNSLHRDGKEIEQPNEAGDARSPSDYWSAQSPCQIMEGLSGSPESRRMQMNVLRECRLPDSMFLLVQLYQTVGMHQKCVELSNLIASEKYGLYKLFSDVRLRMFLGHVNDSIEHLVASTGDPAGYSLELAGTTGRQASKSRIFDLSHGTLEELTTLGWSISQKSFSEQLKKVDNGNRQELLTLLLDSDLREFGVPWIADHKKQEQLDAGGRIVQVVRCRNIAIPLADEDHTNVTGPYTGPRLLRLALTDGRSTVAALDVDNNERLSMNTPPGTKLRLMGTVPLCLGFLILQKQHVQVLGGNVMNLIKEWTMTKLAKVCEGRLRTGAPPFVPFGSREAADLVKSECGFLSSLNVMRNPESGYDSFKTASKSTAAEKENEFDAGFMERRKDIIAEVQQTKFKNSSAADSIKKPASMRFQTGGSKFADLQAEKTQAYDEALAQLVSLNYPMPLAASALKLHKGDYKAALDYLLAKQISSTNLNGRGAGLRSTRRRGGRSSRGGISGPDEEDDPPAAAAGLPRHSAGLTRLSDLLPVTVATHVNTTAPSASNSRPSVSGHTPICLPVGCPILAQNMAGEYEEAQLIGHITSPGASASGDKVVLVVYTRRSNNGPQDEQEELVPLSLIRTLNSEKVSLDMVPPAPPHRARSYNPSTISSEAPSYNPHFADSQSGQFDGNPSRGRFVRPRGRSTATGRGGRPRRFGGGRGGRPPY